ncbi:MAG: TetR/AcrR family transcriptional regulator [Candidatus Thiodiazotropha sp. LLP2]
MSAGRKRAFDKSAALDKAMHVFWENGYSGTSISDLTEALGINKPSLYAAFGNKEQLFTTALEHYKSRYGEPVLEKLTKPADLPLVDRIRTYAQGIVDLVCGKSYPRGCLFVKSSCESGSTGIPDDITSLLQNMGSATQLTLSRLFELEQQQGRISSHTKPEELASYLLSVLYGISVLARQGRPREELNGIIEVAIKGLPLV